MLISYRKAAATLLLLLCVAFGCGAENPRGRVAISGTVKLDGSPLDKGSISFTSPDANGVSSGSTIENGMYQIPVDHGLPPGKYIVRILAATAASASQATAAGPPGPGAPIAPQRVAAKYNQDSKLTVEVPKDSMDFNVTSK
jgi:hypothetical protein